MDVHHYPRTSGNEEKVFIGIPSQGQVEGAFAFSLACAMPELDAAGIKAELCFVLGCCHVDDARNAIVRKFLSTNCGHLVFIDADVSFQPDQLIKLIETKGDLVGGTYPFKKDEAGFPIQIYGESYANDDGLVPCAGLPTGFMKISRKVFADVKEQCEVFGTHDTLDPTVEYFNRTVHDGSRVGGDINFCHKWNRTGGETLLIPDLNLCHTGSKTWKGNFNVYQHCLALGKMGALTKFMKEGNHSEEILASFLNAWGNDYAAPTAFQAAAVALVKETKGPVLELGSGASSAILGTLGGDRVWTVEHDPAWYEKLMSFCEEHDIATNVHLVDLDGEGKYEIPEHFPKSWGLVLVDGPPRALGDRQDAAEIEADVFLIDDCEDYRTQRLIKRLGGEFTAVELGKRTIGIVRR